MPTRPLPLLLLGLVLAGCVIGDEPEEPATATPTFEPEPAEPAADVPDDDIDEADVDEADEASATTEPDGGDAAADSGSSPGSDGSSADDPEESGPSSSASEDEGSMEEAEAPKPETDPESAVLRSHVTDPRGDTEGLRLTSAPDHADLVGALLTRDGDGYRLTIDLDGGAPGQARDGEHTMNVASFYDLTGDGHVDVEVWANLADGGWDTAHYDNRAGTAAFSEDDEIAVDLVDGRLVLDFPLAVLDEAERFRWAVASEWGRYEELGSPTSVRDEMPDDGAPAPFPG